MLPNPKNTRPKRLNNAVEACSVSKQVGWQLDNESWSYLKAMNTRSHDNMLTPVWQAIETLLIDHGLL
jgi:hypothetical protein